MSYEPWPRLDKRARLKFAALGALAWLAVVPAGIAGLLTFGFHGPMNRVWGEAVAMYAVPLLLLLLALLGLACFLCFNRAVLLVVKALAAAILLDILLLAAASHSANSPARPPLARTSIPHPSMTGPMRAVAGPGPVQVGIACSATSGECWTIRYENGREVSRERSTATRPEG